MASDHTIANNLPAGLRVRPAEDSDLERTVEFQNRTATPSQWVSVEAVRHGQAANPEPVRVALLVEDSTDRIVAVGTTGDGGLFRSPDGSWQLGVRVDPPVRKQGVGSALLRPLEAHARTNGARRLIAATRGSDPDGARFAEHHGYSPFHERFDAYIDVASFDASQFDDPDEAVGRIGIRLATYGALLAEHASDVEAFQRAMYVRVFEMARDIPSATPFPSTPPPFEVGRRMLFEGPGMDPATSVVALKDGDVVGVTVTTLKDNGSAYTNLTGVSRAERRKGVALALKLRALRALRERGVQLYGTTNDGPNAAMRGINKKLGYVPDPPTVMYEKTL